MQEIARDEWEEVPTGIPTARISRSGKAINIRIGARLMTVPLRALESVISGKRQTARISSPIIDADRVQREAIDHDLVRSF